MSQADSPVPLDDLLAHRGWERALARRLVGDASRADDVEQEVWLTALRRPPTHARSLRAWFARLVRSRAHDARRGEQRRTFREGAVPPGDPTPPAADVVARLEAHRKLVVALDELAEPYRSTLLLRYYEDLPPREVAARLDVPVETVRTRVRRGREMLRRRLDEDHGEDGRAWIAVLTPLTGIRLKTAAACPARVAGPAAPVVIFVAAGVLLVLSVGVAIFAPGGAASPTPPREPPLESAGVERAQGGGAGPNAGAAAPTPRTNSAPRAFASLPKATGPTVTARDLLDGSAIPELRLRVRVGGEEAALTGDASGRVGLPDGAFALAVPEEGEAVLFAPPVAGHRPVYEAGFTVGRGSVEHDLVLPAVPTEPRVRFLLDGEPLASRELRVSYLTTGSAQAEFAIHLDAEGRTPAGLFEPGELYAVRIRSTGPGGRTRLLDWSGDETEIDLSELLDGTKLSEARRRRADREDGK